MRSQPGVWHSCNSEKFRGFLLLVPAAFLTILPDWDRADGGQGREERPSAKVIKEFKFASMVPTSSVFTKDGKTLILGMLGEDEQRHRMGAVVVWDWRAGKERALLKGHKDFVWGVAVTPDGKTLASASGDETIKLWDLATMRERTSLAAHTDQVRCLCMNPAGKLLASGGGDNKIRIWDVASAKEVVALGGHTDLVLCVAFSPDGKTLAAGSLDKTIRLWDVNGWKHRATLKGHDSFVNCLAFSPDGKTVVSGGEDKTIRFWDCATGQQQRSLEKKLGPVYSLAFHPDGRILVAGSGVTPGRIFVWDVARKESKGIIDGHPHTMQLATILSGWPDLGFRRIGRNFPRWNHQGLEARGWSLIVRDL